MRRTVTSWVVGFVVLAAHTDAAAPPVRPPLPAGAVARFGDPAALHGRTNQLLVSPDGRFLVRHSWDQETRLWDLRAGRRTGLPLPAGSQISHIVGFTPGGEALVCGAGPLRFIARDGRVTRALPLPVKDAPSTLLLSEDGRSLFYHNVNPAGLLVYDLTPGAAGEPTDLRECFGEPVALTPDGALLSVWEFPGTFLLCDTRTGKKLHTVTIPREDGYQFVLAAAFSPDGRAFATTLSVGGFREWRLGAGVAETTTGVGENFRWFRYSADGRAFTALTTRGELVNYDARTWKPTSRALLTRAPLREKDHLVVAASADGKTLVLKPEHGPLQAWDVPSGRQLLVEPYNAAPSRFASVGPSRMRMVRGDRLVEWDLQTGRLLADWSLPDTEREVQARLHPGRLAFPHHDVPTHQVVVSCPATAKELYRVGPVTKWKSSGDPVLATRGRDWVAVANAGPVRVYRAGRATPAVELTFDNDPVAAVAFSADGRSLVHVTKSVWASNDGGRVTQPYRELVVTELASRQVRACVPLRLSNTGEDIRELLLDDAGRVVVAVCRADAFVIDLPTATITSHHDGATTACLSPDGRWLALGGRLSDLRGPRPHRVIPLEGGEDRGYAGAFSRDGKHLVTTCADGTALVWDIAALARRTGAPSGLPSLWDKLARPDAIQAAEAMRALTTSPGDAVRLIRDRLPPAARLTDDGALARLLADLDSPRHAVREAAERRLAQLGEQAEAALREVVRDTKSLEQRLRARRLLRPLEYADPGADELRGLRAIEVLERIGTDEARRLLDRLAAGAPRARLTAEAKAALARLRLLDAPARR